MQVSGLINTVLRLDSRITTQLYHVTAEEDTVLFDSRIQNDDTGIKDQSTAEQGGISFYY